MVVPGHRPLEFRRNGVVVRRPVEARADRIIVQLHTQWLDDALRGRVDLEQAFGSRLARFWPRFGLISLPVAPERLFQTLEALRRHPAVEAADLDYLVYPAYVPDTPEYRKQYHHDLISTPAAWDVRAPGAWRETVIAMVDTGVDLDHPDLTGRIWVNTDEIPGNGVDDDHNGFVDDVYGWDFYNNNNDPNPEPDGKDNNYDGTPDEQVSHGTLGAGLAGAKVYDNWGTAGVYPNARIMAIQVFPDDGGTDYETVVDGLQYAVDNGAEIINLSIGAPWSTLFTNPIIKAHNRNMVVVAAAGNYSRELTDTYWWSPVCNEGRNPLTDNYVIGVAYTDKYDRKGSYSNYDGSTGRHFVDVSAPGDAIYGPAYYDPSFPGFTDYFYTNTGTSFSAPMVSGLAALVKALHPDWSPDQIRDQIVNTSDNIDRLNPGYAGKLGSGRINCARALGVGLAPRPPTNLQASDTPQDNGGSITLTWTLSLDDGAGSGKVTLYEVLRRDGATGSFLQIAQIAAGTDFYHDTTVEDGRDYYYQVGASDGTNVSYAGPVGPVRASDNLPPPTVTTLTAADVPGDNGGAIELQWTGYAWPADCTGYRIYRDGYPFDAIGAREPLAAIPVPSLQSYVDTSVVDFVDYYYAVTAVDATGNENKNVQAVGPVQSYPNESMRLAAGTWLLSPPVVPPDANPSSLFGPDSAFRAAGWDPVNERYVLYEPGVEPTAFTSLALGRGLWVWARNLLSFDLLGETAGAGNLTVDVDPGWQLLGNPYFAAMDYGATQVQVGTTVMSLLAAEQDGYLSSAAYLFDAAAFSYKLLSPGWTGTTWMPAWAGFWLRVYQPCRITFRRPATPTQTAAALPAGTVQPAQAPSATDLTVPTPQWKIRLIAAGAHSRDTDNFVGVCTQALAPAPEPPPAATSCPRLWIEEGKKAYSALALRPSSRLLWRLALTPAAGEDRTWIEAEIGNEVPEAYAIILRDLDTGATFDLRQQRRVEVAGTGTRRLELQMTRTEAATLAVTSMAVQARQGRAQIVFSLSAPAYCDVEVLNIAGRTVRRVQQQGLMAAGQNVVVWDGRGDGGAPVPRGVYLVRLRARAEDGSMVQGIRTMSLQR